MATYQEIYNQQKNQATDAYNQGVKQVNQNVDAQKQESYIAQQKALSFLNTMRSYQGQQGLSKTDAIGVQNTYQQNLNDINTNKNQSMDTLLASYQAAIGNADQAVAQQELADKQTLSSSLQSLATYGLESRLNNLLSQYSSDQELDKTKLKDDLTQWLTDQYGTDLTENDMTYLNKYIETLLQDAQGTSTSTADSSTDYGLRSTKYSFDYNGKTLYLDFGGVGEGYKADNLFNTTKKEDVAQAVNYMLKSGEMPSTAEIKDLLDISSTSKANSIIKDLETFLKQNNVTLG
ncbi:MAG: hypothetical protein AB7E61_02430 [Acholeplasmataceae bacterium]